MTNLTVQLDGEAYREATVQAISGLLTGEARTNLIESAIRAILKPSTNSWDKGVSPIETAFQNAITRLAGEECKKMIEQDQPLREKIQALLREVADRVLSADVEKLSERMADAFVSSLRRND